MTWATGWYLHDNWVDTAHCLAFCYHLMPASRHPFATPSLSISAYPNILAGIFVEDASQREHHCQQRANDGFHVLQDYPMSVPADLPLPEPPPWFRFWWMIDDWEVSQASDAWDYLPPLLSWSQLVNSFIDDHNPSDIAKIQALGLAGPTTTQLIPPQQIKVALTAKVQKRNWRLCVQIIASSSCFTGRINSGLPLIVDTGDGFSSCVSRRN